MPRNPAHTVYAKLYLEGTSVPSVVTASLPDLEQGVEEFRAFGIAGGINMPKLGHFEPMECTITPRSYVPEIEKGLKYGELVNIELRIAIADLDHSSGKVNSYSRIVNMRVVRTNRTSDEIEQGREEGPEYVCQVHYYKEELDGDVIHEIDPLNMKAVHNGTDLLSSVRSIIGS